MNNPLREIIYLAKCNNIEVNEVTVSPTYYKILEDEAVLTRIYDKGPTALRFNNVVINKRKCKGCCQHE